ncbi:hypothetical protein QCA50_017770 [Cerrena zonata]|uniref:Uncharacterized protein n=1 Tax=Cerrena zonata TaxID=2478898 RepID=A0AAW0FG32_9APHY
MTTPNGILGEAVKRNITFEVEKSAIQDFTRKRIPTYENGKNTASNGLITSADFQTRPQECRSSALANSFSQ